ncbi:hypothetical protein, partial [Escherichia coli]|uniref:hypothetical protein n=1 Tax=Escherichia coli TaxID=562 RepID=UPI001BDBAB46
CWKGWAILLRQKQKKLIMLPSETMIWQPEFTDKTLSRKPGAVHHPCGSFFAITAMNGCIFGLRKIWHQSGKN